MFHHDKLTTNKFNIVTNMINKTLESGPVCEQALHILVQDVLASLLELINFVLDYSQFQEPSKLKILCGIYFQ